MIATKKFLAILMPVMLLAMMYPIFQGLGRRYGDQASWFIGLGLYWLLWGVIFAGLMLGPQAIFELARPQAFSWKAVLLASLPIIFASVGRFIFGMSYQESATWAAIGLIITAFGNGVFEEVIWRGLYLELFPESWLWGVVWPSLWFGLWHLAPGSVAGDGESIGLVVGAIFLGLLLSVLSRETGTIWWGIVAHTLAGLVTVL